MSRALARHTPTGVVSQRGRQASKCAPVEFYCIVYPVASHPVA